MAEPNILYTKEDFTFYKNTKNNYSLSFLMRNNNMILSKIIDFNLVKLIYDLNNDIYEKVNIEIINENEAISNLLIRNLFEEIGLPQLFSYVHMSKIVKENQIKFVLKSIKDKIPDGMPLEANLLPIENMICDCDIVDQHTIKFTCNIIIENTLLIPQIAEKLIGIIIFKIFNRVKQFIENVRM